MTVEYLSLFCFTDPFDTLVAVFWRSVARLMNRPMRKTGDLTNRRTTHTSMPVRSTMISGLTADATTLNQLMPLQTRP
jgi:hypothetical protein